MKVTESQIIEMLYKCYGLCSIAADHLKITPSALSQRIKNNKKLQKVLDDAREKRIDLGEYKLFSAVNRDEPWAIKYLLNNQGLKRGYGYQLSNRQDLDKNDKNDIKNETIIFLPKNGRD